MTKLIRVQIPGSVAPPPVAAVLGATLALLLTGCSLKQRPYAFAVPAVPRMGSYGTPPGQVGAPPGYPAPYGGNYGPPQYNADQVERCNQLDSTYVGLGAAAAGAAVAAGSVGAIAGISEADKDVKIGLAIGSGVLAAFSAVSSVVSQAKGQQFQRQCPQMP